MVTTHPHIVFVCDRNAARSPMAAALLRARPDMSGVRIESAGLDPADSPDPLAVCVMAEAGFDISGHTPTALNAAQWTPDTLVVTLTQTAFARAHDARANPRANQGFALEYWDVPAPPALGEMPRDAALDATRAILSALKSHVANRFGP